MQRFTPGRIWFEAALIREREHNRMLTEAMMIYAAVVDWWGGTRHLTEIAEKLDE